MLVNESTSLLFDTQPRDGTFKPNNSIERRKVSVVKPRPKPKPPLKLSTDCRKFLLKYANDKAGKPDAPINFPL